VRYPEGRGEAVRRQVHAQGEQETHRCCDSRWRSRGEGGGGGEGTVNAGKMGRGKTGRDGREEREKSEEEERVAVTGG
jgi:hypothetical protein